MTEKGVFDKYDSVIMVHLETKNITNMRFSAFETYELKYTGKPARTAASPWDGRSALDALMLSVHGFDLIRKSLKPGAIIEGFIQEAGVATNIIPEKSQC